MKLKLNDIVEIQWQDSIHDSGWKFSDSYTVESQRSDLNHRTVGYVLFNETDFITVLQSRAMRVHDDGTYCVDSKMTIPKCCIQEITLLSQS